MLDLSISPLNPSSPSLKIHEWLAIFVLIVILGGLSIMAYVTKGSIGYNDRAMPALLSHPAKIEVFINGAVINSGIYYLPSGIQVKEVLMLAQPAPNADLRRLNLNSLLKKGRAITIPELPMINVYVEGAVENPGRITVPKGIRLMDIKDYIILSEHANVKSLNRKRKLKEGEIITVSIDR